MTARLEWARAEPGLLKSELRVRESNSRARRLYEIFGFVEA
ncbi:GNAT family N-acetyltransferase [Pseudomonas yamanorum]